MEIMVYFLLYHSRKMMFKVGKKWVIPIILDLT